jgi:hypothetical protein
MHVGKSYPYHWEHWCLSGQFWPGFAPRNVCVTLGIGTPPGFSPFEGAHPHCSEASLWRQDREQMHWNLPYGTGGVSFWLECTTVVEPPYKYTEYHLFGSTLSLLQFHGKSRRGTPDYTFGGVLPFHFTYDISLIPFPAFDLQVAVEPRSWGGQSPPADNHELGRWLAHNTARY